MTATAPRGSSSEAWALVAAVQRGDREAFGKLYEKYASEVFRFILSRVRSNHHLAQDLTSETFLRALRGIGSLREQVRDPGAWLRVIARNLVVDHVRSARTRLDTLVADMRDADTGDSPELAVIRAEAVTELRRCVAALLPDQRECIELRFLRELSPAETAVAMGRSYAAIKGLTFRSVRDLRVMLTDTEAAA